MNVLEVLNGRQLVHSSFYFAVLLQRSQSLKFDFVSNGLQKDGATDRQVLLVLVITAEFLSVFFFLQNVYFN